MTTPAAPTAAKPEDKPLAAPPTTGSPAGTPTSPPAPSATPASPFVGLTDVQKDQLLSVYAGTIREQKGAIEQLQRDVATVRSRQDAPPAPDAAKLNKEFYERPMEMVTDIVRKEVSAAIAPLTDFVRGASARTEYDRIKDELKADPRVKQVFDVAEWYIDGLVTRQADAGAKITRDTVVAAVAGVRGAVELGWLDLGGAPAPAPAPAPPASPPATGPQMFTPPHLRPSAPPAPGPLDKKPELRDLTENEERLRRENRMTKEEFLAGLDMAARDVVDVSKWPKKEGK